MRDLVLTWAGVEYSIPERRIFALGEAVEDVVTLTDIQGWHTRPQFRRMSRAYGTMLRFAGARVSDEEVFDAVVGPKAQADVASQAIVALLVALMGDRSGDEAAGAPGESSAS